MGIRSDVFGGRSADGAPQRIIKIHPGGTIPMAASVGAALKFPKVKLRNGSQVDVRIVVAEFELLEDLQSSHPAMLLALIEAAKTDQPIKDQSMVPFLQCVIDQEGALRPNTRNVLLSSIHETREGAVLVSPVETEENRQLMARVNEFGQANLRRILSNEDQGRIR